MNAGQFALIKKDIQSITSNKQVLAVLLIVPLVLTIALPSIFVFVLSFAPDAASDFQKLLDMLPDTNGEPGQQQRIFGLILNQIMPSFFMIIPIMASSVMAASSFVGEKEKHTLETLLYSPLSMKQLFQSKIMAGFYVGMMVSYTSFAAMLLVLELEMFFLAGSLILPTASWLAIMLLIASAISIAAIAGFPDSCPGHRAIHRYHSDKCGTSLGSGHCFGGACRIAHEGCCRKLHLRKITEVTDITVITNLVCERLKMPYLKENPLFRKTILAHCLNYGDF